MSDYTRTVVKVKDAAGQIQTAAIPLVKSSSKLYHNAQHLMLELNSSERCFFDFLCEEMDFRNNVFIDKHFKQAFLDHLGKISHSKKSINVVMITTFVQKLHSLGLLLENGSKGFYVINPKYAFKGSDKNRVLLLQYLVEDRIPKGRSIKDLVDVSEESFLKRLNRG